MSKGSGSVASVCMEDSQLEKLQTLCDCITGIAKFRPTFSMKKPLTQDHNQKTKRLACKAAAKMFKVVCETLHPRGLNSEIVIIAEEALLELKKCSSDCLPKSVKSIVEQYRNCESKLLRRALLSEIVKHVGLKQLKQHLGVTKYE